MALYISLDEISLITSPSNYFCLPFITSNPKQVSIKGFYICLLLLDVFMVSCCIGCYTYLFTYIRRQMNTQSLKDVRKRTKALQRFASRMAIVILSNSLSWLPLIVVQILVLSDVALNVQIFLWVVISCLPVNLIIDPILVIRGTIQY